MGNFRVKASGIVFISAALLVTACGGGGGGGGGGQTFTPPAISQTPVAINSSNQYQVADTAANGIAGGTSGSTVVLGAVIDSEPNSISAFELGKRKFSKYAVGAATAIDALPAGVAVSATQACDSNTGSVSMSGNVTNTDPTTGYMTAGDSISLSFNNCLDNLDGSITNGTISFTIVTGTVPLNNFGGFTGTVTIATSFNNLRTTIGGVTDVIHGDFTISSDGTTETLSGNSLYILQTGGVAVHLTNFSMSVMTVGNVQTSTVDMTIASTEINGLITVRTASGDPVVQNLFETHPSAGTLIITGSGTTLTMVILSTTQVSLSLDSNSDGTPDAGYPVTITWTEIDNGTAAIP